MTDYKDKDSLVEKVLRKLIVFTMIMALVVPFITPHVFASASLSVSGSDTVKGGEKFTVTVTYSGGDVGRVNGQLTYDSTMLKYLSGGSSTGDTGYIQLKQAGTDGSISFTIEFQALSEGDTALEVTTNDIYDLDEREMEAPSASKTIRISGDAAKEEIVTETQTQATTTEAETTASISETKALSGVDEKPEEESNITVILIVVAVVLIGLIVVISSVLVKKRKSRRNKKITMDDM